MSTVPFAQENKPQGGECVERDPEAGNQLLLQGKGRGLGVLLIFGELLDFGGLSRVDVVDETFG
jgi:hypothetical protein